jgi:hypothetical protein
VLLGGASAVLLGNARQSNAFWPLLWQALQAVAGAWGLYQVGKEVYNEFFSEEQQAPINNELREYNVTINKIEQTYNNTSNHFNITNPYQYREFREREPGIECHPSGWASALTIIIGGVHGNAIAINPGFAIALGAILELLQERFAPDNCWAYTRPIQYWRRSGPWENYGNGGLGWQKKMSYYTPNGSVSLRWYIPDARYGVGRVQGIVRDSTSGNIIEGESSEFKFVR